MGACSMLGTFNKTTANTVCGRLNAKYNEKFEAEYIGNRIDTNSATLYVHPKDTPKLMFKAVIDNDGNVTDDYVSNIIIYQIENDIVDEFSKIGIDCAVDGSIISDVSEETDKSLSVNEFADKHNIEDIYFKIGFYDESISKEKMLLTFKNISQKYSSGLLINGYFLSTDKYLKCAKKFDGDNKIFVDTSSMYFGSNNAFSNYKEYSSQCRLISAIVYTKKLIMMMKWQMKC